MQYVKIPKADLSVSKICLGCMSYGDPRSKLHPWALNEEQSLPFIQRAIELGINFFDTANMYSDGASEVTLGKAIRKFAKRSEIVVATKVFHPVAGEPDTGGLGRKAIFSAIDGSLRRLGTDYVDLYQIHRWDYKTPIEETLEALDEVVRSGKARYIGASSMMAWQFAKAIFTSDKNGWSSFVSMQPHYNLINREEEREMLPFCIDQSISVFPWSPLARGRLARAACESDTNRSKSDKFGEYLYSSTEASDRLVIERVGAIAARRAMSSAQVALAWVLQKSGVMSAIVGATKMNHLDDAVAALSVGLSDEEIKYLEEPYVPHALAGNLP